MGMSGGRKTTTLWSLRSTSTPDIEMILSIYCNRFYLTFYFYFYFYSIYIFIQSDFRGPRPICKVIFFGGHSELNEDHTERQKSTYRAYIIICVFVRVVRVDLVIPPAGQIEINMCLITTFILTLTLCKTLSACLYV